LQKLLHFFHFLLYGKNRLSWAAYFAAFLVYLYETDEIYILKICCVQQKSSPFGEKKIWIAGIPSLGAVLRPSPPERDGGAGQDTPKK